MAKCHARLVLSLCCTLTAAHNDNDEVHVGHIGGHGIDHDQDHDYDVIKPVQDLYCLSAAHRLLLTMTMMMMIMMLAMKIMVAMLDAMALIMQW